MNNLRDAAKGLKTLPQNGEERWNRVHEARHLGTITDKDPGALSGSSAESVLEYHQVADLICPGLIVLDIGVGMGNMSRYLHSCLCHVDAMDVADKAETTVQGYVHRFYPVRDIQSLSANKYDLAISMIVAQHMSDENLRQQISHVFRALKPGGIFSLHLAGATRPYMNNIAGPIPAGKDGAMCRTPDYAIDLVGDVLENQPHGLKLLDRRMQWPKFNSYWYFLRITKEGEG